jgi:hypothetical protein
MKTTTQLCPACGKTYEGERCECNAVLAANAKDYGTGQPKETDISPQRARKATEPQRLCREGPLEECLHDQKASTERVHIRIVSTRKRLLDPDNLVPKWHIDCLRFIGAIRGDEPDKITLEVSQVKAAKGQQEIVTIEVFEL